MEGPARGCDPGRARREAGEAGRGSRKSTGIFGPGKCAGASTGARRGGEGLAVAGCTGSPTGELPEAPWPS